MSNQESIGMGKTSWNQALMAGPGPVGFLEYLFLWLKGFAMGTADLIPGVSGGTIAFITGIYEQLLEAVSSFDRQAFGHLFKLELKAFFGRVHIRFIVTLASGLIIAIFTLARLMHFLLTEYPLPTWGLFFGLICASVIIIWRELEKPFAVKSLIPLILGGVAAFFIVGLIPVSTPDDMWFIFVCGVIGISAMILPGLSGSFLLLILGKYEYITGALKNPLVGHNFIILLVFLMGALTGLLGFSKVLNWLMKHYRMTTMAVLTGILIGSLRKVWPWKEVLETVAIRGKERIISEANIFPTYLNSQDYVTIFMMIFGFLAVILMEFFRQKRF